MPTLPTSLLARFSPTGGCTQIIADLLAAAACTVRGMIYEFTSPDLLAAFKVALANRVDVQVIADPITLKEPGGQIGLLKQAGATIYIDPMHAIMHNKTLVVDGVGVLTGSFNWTTSAEEKNAENLVWIPDAATAALYLANWSMHRGHSTQA
jgi:phosphatidylserine/phosphatidylglycerophosphate/cardiolipin synthase-like enzyme